VSAVAVGRLDVARARQVTKRLRGAADLMLDLVVEAYEGRVWEVLGHDSWSAYVAAEVPALAVIGKGLPVEQRREAVAVLRGRGLSLRGVSEVLGIAPNTVRTDAAAAGVQLAEVIGLDGARRASARTAPARRRRGPAKTDRTVALLAGAGPDGLTVREVARELRCEQHKAAATLTRLEDAERIIYRAPERRGQFGRYVVHAEGM
jgi:hypothetical protein